MSVTIEQLKEAFHREEQQLGRTSNKASKEIKHKDEKLQTAYVKKPYTGEQPIPNVIIIKNTYNEELNKKNYNKPEPKETIQEDDIDLQSEVKQNRVRSRQDRERKMTARKLTDEQIQAIGKKYNDRLQDYWVQQEPEDSISEKNLLESFKSNPDMFMAKLRKAKEYYDNIGLQICESAALITDLASGLNKTGILREARRIIKLVDGRKD